MRQFHFSYFQIDSHTLSLLCRGRDSVPDNSRGSFQTQKHRQERERVLHMNEISIAVRYNNDLRTVSGRELHKVLQIKTHYALWFDRMRDYGFRENTDFFTVFKNVFRDLK